MSGLKREIPSYVLVGAGNTLVAFGLFSLFSIWVLPNQAPLVNIVLAHLVAVPVSFATQAAIVFKAQPTFQAFIRFFAVSFLGLSGNLIAFPIVQKLTNFDQVTVQGIILASIAAATFLISKFFTFANDVKELE